MSGSPFSTDDLAELEAHGIGEAEAMRQWNLLVDPPAQLEIERPCTPGDGIERIAPARHAAFAAAHDRAAAAGRWLRFVPASGAATRMFHALTAVRRQPGLTHESLAAAAAQGFAEAADALVTLDGIERFAFRDALAAVVARTGGSLARLRDRGDVRTVLDALLEPDGLGLAARPKGLIEFHREGDVPRTAFEEQLREVMALARDRLGCSRTHFTVSPEHDARFRALLDRLRPSLERGEGEGPEVGFSHQHPSTDTLALASDGAPFRLDGRLLLRPAGHGALIENLAELGADLVSIKNIDNVQPVTRREPTLLAMRLLGGRLLELETEVHAALARLDDPGDAGAAREAARVAHEAFGFDLAWAPEDADARARARECLDRPIRVCGMVPNTGEPGGGPFWVRGRDGTRTRQIVESAEIDATRAGQREVFASGTHFNPVFMTASLRRRDGRPHALEAFVDPEAVIVTSKSAAGHGLRALERPGLWNGAMARWLTVFVEVPGEVFTPVKTLNDLLRPEHQS